MALPVLNTFLYLNGGIWIGVVGSMVVRRWPVGSSAGYRQSYWHGKTPVTRLGGPERIGHKGGRQQGWPCCDGDFFLNLLQSEPRWLRPHTCFKLKEVTVCLEWRVSDCAVGLEPLLAQFSRNAVDSNRIRGGQRSAPGKKANDSYVHAACE